MAFTDYYTPHIILPSLQQIETNVGGLREFPLQKASEDKGAQRVEVTGSSASQKVFRTGCSRLASSGYVLVHKLKEISIPCDSSVNYKVPTGSYLNVSPPSQKSRGSCSFSF